MADICKTDGCQLEQGGHCPEHHQEVERRRNTDKVVEELRETQEHFKKHISHMRSQSEQQKKLLWINAGSLGLLLSGLGLTLYLIGYVNDGSKQRYEMGMGVATELRQESSEIDQQSINRDHLIIEMQETDRALQTELIKATERVTTKLEAVIERLEELEDG